MKAVVKKIFIAIMAALLVLPWVWMLLIGTQPMEISENRERAQRPGLSLAYRAAIDNGEYCESFSAWFNDNYGLRDVMIRTKNQIEYSVFRIANGVYIGKEGYLVYRDTIKSQGKCEELDDGYYEQLIGKISDTRDALAEKGTAFYVMFPPLKNTVYVDKFDSVPAKRSTPTAYENLCEMMNREFPDSFIDVRDILQQAARIAPIYFKTDFHWNNHGATAAYSVLVNKIAGEQIYTFDDYYVATYEGFSGTQLNNFCILQTITERGYTAAGETTSVEGDKAELPQSLMHLVNTADAPLGRLLIVGDSYSNYIMKYNAGISDSFSEVYYVNMNDNSYDGILGGLENGQFDYVIFESIETSAPDYLDKLQRMAG